jgi:hypothetical protein
MPTSPPSPGCAGRHFPACAVEERVRPPASLRGRADCAVLHASPTHRLPPMRSRHVQSAAHAATIHRRGAAEPDTLDAVQLVNFGTARRPDPPPSCRARPGIHLAKAATSEVPALRELARERRMGASFVIPGMTRDPRCRETLPLRRHGPRLKVRVTTQGLGRRILSRAGRRQSPLRRIPVARWCAGVAWSSPRGLLQARRGRIPAEHRASASTCSTCPPAPGGSV